MKAKTLVPHQLLSLVLQDPRLGGRTASMLKNTEVMKDSLHASHTFCAVTRHLRAWHTSPRLPAQLSVTFNTTAATLNTLMPETGGKKKKKKDKRQNGGKNNNKRL